MEGSASSPRRANAARVSSGCSRIHLRSNMDVTLLLAPATAPAAGGPPGTKKKPPDFRGGLDRGATLILPDAPRRRMARAGCIGPNRLASPPRASDGAAGRLLRGGFPFPPDRLAAPAGSLDGLGEGYWSPSSPLPSPLVSIISGPGRARQGQRRRAQARLGRRPPPGQPAGRSPPPPPESA